MLWTLYNVLFAIGYVLMTPRFLLRMWRRGGYGRGFFQRFGFYASSIREKLRARSGRIWIHAVSVGEILVAWRFVEELRRAHGNFAFIISTTTSTGHALAQKLVKPDDVLIYFPLDFPPVLQRALSILNPRVLILTECEIWPNLVRLLKQRNVPIILINGRISRSSYRGYSKIRLFLAPVLRWMDLFLVQSDADRDRLVSLGADTKKVFVVGSAKYDVVQTDPAGEQAARALIGAAGFDPGDPILLGGSTWPGEEVALMETYRRLKVRWPALRLVLVPRHAERAEKIVREIRSMGLTYVRRTGLQNGRATTVPDVLLVDTTGELKNLYGVATVIFVGKSLMHRGGQNIIEPAVASKPIVVGPHMENFEDVMEDFRQARAVVEVRDREELCQAIERLLASSEDRNWLGKRAFAVVEAKRGVVRRSVALMDGILGVKQTDPAIFAATRQE